MTRLNRMSMDSDFLVDRLACFFCDLDFWLFFCIPVCYLVINGLHNSCKLLR
jgi:hypothetical protein